MKILIPIAIFLLASMSSWAQRYEISDPVNIRHDYGYEIIGRLKDRILLFRDKYDEFEVQAFDNSMRASWNKELDIEKRGVQILAVIGAKNDFSVIYKVKRKNTAYLRILKYDPGATLIDSLTIKTYPEHFFTSPNLEILQSEDKNCFVVYNNANLTTIEAVCFKIDKMERLWDVKMDKTPYLQNSIFEKSVLSNAGQFFVITEQNNKRSKLEEHEYHIYAINSTGEKHIEVPLQEFLTHDAVFSFDNLNNALVGAGLYGEKTRNRANGAFFVKIIPGDSTATTLKFQPFDSRFNSIMTGKDLSEDIKGLEDLSTQKQVLRRDGGTILIGEVKYEVERGTANGRNFMRDGARNVVDYHYNDIFIIAFYPDGSIHWRTILHKKQFSQDDEATFSSFFTFQQPESLHFLFNDEIKYENTCSEYSVSLTGDFDRTSLFSTIDQALRIRFRDGIQISANECLLPSEFRNRLKLVLLKY